MTTPNTKVEVYNAGSVIYTFTNFCPDIQIRSVLNGVGSFNISLPVKSGSGFRYSDIAKEDQVKVYVSNTDTFSATPDFMGMIYQISGVNGSDGYLRVLSGKDNGEVLQRLQKHGYMYNDVDADDVVADVITDCSLGTDIDVEARNVSIAVETESYYDILKRVSDYWIDGANQVKKDWYVDVGDAGHFDGHLIWKARPIRSSGVETITTSTPNFTYNVWRSLDEKNSIRVIGDSTKRYPAADDMDTLTDGVGNWNLVNGDAIVLDAAIRKEGAGSIHADRHVGTGANELHFYRSISSTPISIGKDKYKRVNFWWCENIQATPMVFFYCPNNANKVALYLVDDPTSPPPPDVLSWYSRSFRSPSDFDQVWGTPDFDDCQGIAFYLGAGADIQLDMRIDALFIDDCSYSGTASSGAADKDLEVTDLQLKSDSECAQRAETLLFQLASIPARVDVNMPGNLNVKIGDRVPLTVVAEGISAANYDVLSVTHTIMRQPPLFSTQASMVAAGDMRELSPLSVQESTLKAMGDLRRVSKGTQAVGYR